ncbi:MAG: hypothetical protein LBK05_02580 [Treponema sp.]|jgi:hypothetical protein|nr:hypothetical protein [Treponema sp.]
MDSILENLPYAVIIGIAIAVQIARLFIGKSGKRRRGRAEERPETAVYREQPPERLEAAAYRDYGEDEDEAFSAWNLSVDDDEKPAAPALPAQTAAPRPVSVPFSAPLSAPDSGFFPALPSAPDSGPFSTLAAAPASGAENPEPERPYFPAPESGLPPGGGAQYAGRGKARLAGRAGFPERLDYLPPLKRAVVLAEILGRPKGL